MNHHHQSLCCLLDLCKETFYLSVGFFFCAPVTFPLFSLPLNFILCNTCDQCSFITHLSFLLLFSLFLSTHLSLEYNIDCTTHTHTKQIASHLNHMMADCSTIFTCIVTLFSSLLLYRFIDTKGVKMT